MNQQQIDQFCLMAEKQGLHPDMDTYRAMVELSVEQAKVENPLSPDVKPLLIWNAAMRNADLTDELLSLDDDGAELEDTQESKE